MGLSILYIISATFLRFFILLCWFSDSMKNPILGYIYKVVDNEYKNYVIYVS